MSLVLFRGQLRFMADRGLEVRVVTSPGPLLAPFADGEGVGFDAVPMRREISPLRDLVSVARLIRVMLRRRPAIVHAHTPKGGLLGMIAAWLARVPIRIYQMRGLPFETATGWRRWLLRTAEWLACRLAHQVLTVSDSLQKVAVVEGLCPPTKIRVLANGSSNGVDAAGKFDPDRLEAGTRERIRGELGIPAECRVIGFVGRLAREKGLGDLAAAWARLRSETPDLYLLLVGPVDARDPIPEDTWACLDADDRVRSTGPAWDTAPLYAAMDVLVLPTYREGFGNVLIEAAAMRLPVVSTTVSGVVDAVEDGQTGALVPPGDPSALAAALRRYLDSRELRAAHGDAGRARVLTRFLPEVVWNALCTEYQRLLAERGQGTGGPSMVSWGGA